MEYAMSELMRNPGTMSKLQDDVTMAIPQGKEIVTEDDMDGVTVPYLKAVTKKTLTARTEITACAPFLHGRLRYRRLYSSVWNTKTLINIWPLARDPNYWEYAEDFVPERFMEGGSAAKIDYVCMGNNFLYLSFGSGRSSFFFYYCN
jgi:cytochrome P450